MISALLFVVSYALGISWSILFIIFVPLGLRIIQIKDKLKQTVIHRHVAYSTIYSENMDAAGFIIGKWFCGYIHTTPNYGSRNGGDKSTIYLLIGVSSYKKIIEEMKPKVNHTKPTVSVKLLERFGASIYDFTYSIRELDVIKYVPRDNQMKIIKTIKKTYKLEQKCVTYVYGEAGTGKSTLGYLLAQSMNGILYDTFNPTQPNNFLNRIYYEINPTEKSPLIIVIEEVDTLIKDIHKGIEAHESILTEIKNKPEWSKFFDEFDRKIRYPNLIVLLTSNVSHTEIDKLDKAYLREGRIDHKFELTK